MQAVGTQRQVAALRWGLVPAWAKDIKIGAKSINARAETVAEKPMFRAALNRRRCLIPADGYYEWQAAGKQKRPFHFRYPDQRPFAFAGPWEVWRGPQGNDAPLETCTIITTASVGVAAPIYDRMPVIIPSHAYDAWLGIMPPSHSELQALLHHPNLEGLVPVPVSTLVNSVKNDTAECVQQIPE